MRWRTGLGLVAVLAIAGVAFVEIRGDAVAPKPVVAPLASASPKADAGAGARENEEEDRSPALHPPTGALAALSCVSAALIVGEVESELAFRPTPPTPAELAAGTKDWIDPHGHWAVAPDAPPFAAIDADAAGLLAEIAQGTTCPASQRIGKQLAAWVDAERARFDARAALATGNGPRALADALDVTSRDGGTTTTAIALTDELADRAGTLRRAYGVPVAKYVQSARNRFFPEMTEGAWSEVVLAAAVRAWVEAVDAHGAWAPYGEEATVHDVDLDQDAPLRLWSRATRTFLGVRIDDGALAPMRSGDVILEVAGMSLAGLPVEQLDELALTAADTGEPFEAVVMHEGDTAPRTIRIDPDVPASPGVSTHPFDLATEIVPYGSGEIAVVAISDVYDDLGELFTRALSKARSPKLAGVVLDLRGNGGGSTEGAINTLGVFLPDARLFPMRNRSGVIETDRAPQPPADEVWSGPVATLVDGGTASAAEMMAGALAAYRRGPSVGAPTYGKGCAQEYLDDDAHAGLLRVTTLLFALPDGSPVQRIGLTPTIAFPFHDAETGADDREAKLSHSPDPWTGPDVRDRAWVLRASQFAWPSSNGHLGPCKDERVCKALALLGETHLRGATASRTNPNQR